MNYFLHEFTSDFGLVVHDIYTRTICSMTPEINQSINKCWVLILFYKYYIFSICIFNVEAMLVALTKNSTFYCPSLNFKTDIEPLVAHLKTGISLKNAERHQPLKVWPLIDCEAPGNFTELRSI